MSNYISVDGGTTNTRLFLSCDGKITDTVKYAIGAGSGDKAGLIEAIKNGVATLLERNCLKSRDIEIITASGMLTSELGIITLEHIKAPVGIKQLHETAEKAVLPEICDIPFYFIRGVKIGDNVNNTDMMRGEETELMGLMSHCKAGCVYILPGSHSKIIKTDKDGNITDFTTMMTGEMLAALSENTVLKNAFTLKNGSLKTDYLFSGFECCREKGVNAALFKTRVLKNVFGCTQDEAYSFFLGAVICDEIIAVLNMKAEKIVIAGKKAIREAEAALLEKYADCEIITADNEACNTATALGGIAIYEYCTE